MAEVPTYEIKSGFRICHILKYNITIEGSEKFNQDLVDFFSNQSIIHTHILVNLRLKLVLSLTMTIKFVYNIWSPSHLIILET